MDIQIPQALVDEVTKGRATLFLGAGSSKEANFPDGRMIADFLMHACEEPLDFTSIIFHSITRESAAPPTLVINLI